MGEMNEPYIPFGIFLECSIIEYSRMFQKVPKALKYSRMFQIFENVPNILECSKYSKMF